MRWLRAEGQVCQLPPTWPCEQRQWLTSLPNPTLHQEGLFSCSLEIPFVCVTARVIGLRALPVTIQQGKRFNQRPLESGINTPSHISCFSLLTQEPWEEHTVSLPYWCLSCLRGLSETGILTTPFKRYSQWSLNPGVCNPWSWSCIWLLCLCGGFLPLNLWCQPWSWEHMVPTQNSQVPRHAGGLGKSATCSGPVYGWAGWS